jgi:hypothetical protein
MVCLELLEMPDNYGGAQRSQGACSQEMGDRKSEAPQKKADTAPIIFLIQHSSAP